MIPSERFSKSCGASVSDRYLRRVRYAVAQRSQLSYSRRLRAPQSDALSLLILNHLVRDVHTRP